MEERSNDRSRMIRYVICISGFIVLQVFTVISGRFGLATFNGVAIAFQYGLCLILTQSGERKDMRTAGILMAISAVFTVQAMIVGRRLSVLPGMVNIVFYIGTLALIARANRKKEIEYLTDILTGVYNQKGLYKILDNKVESGKHFQLIYFILDNFKQINNNYGPVFGDELLCKVARRIAAEVDSNVEIARVGGAVFAVVVEEDVDAVSLADRILTRIRRKSSLVVNEMRVDCFVKCYAGIAAYPTHAGNSKDVITFADIAMYEAVQQKSKSAFTFEMRMAHAVNRQIEVEKMVKDGLERDYFYLVYQPQFQLDGKKLRGFETLIRMKTPDGSSVSPGEFIPVAEKGELILQIDDYVLRRVMREFRSIVEDNPELVVSVNVSAKNIGSENFVESVRWMLQENHFPAKNLEIEITEYCMVHSIEVTKANIASLREMGIRIALDDFGTGYTSLHYLSELPINLLKIDKSLIDDIENSEKRRKFVQTIISMGHLMGCEVISEGVELESQVNFLEQDECDYLQGYVWGKPLGYEVARELAYKGNCA